MSAVRQVYAPRSIKRVRATKAEVEDRRDQLFDRVFKTLTD